MAIRALAILLVLVGTVTSLSGLAETIIAGRTLHRYLRYRNDYEALDDNTDEKAVILSYTAGSLDELDVIEGDVAVGALAIVLGLTTVVYAWRVLRGQRGWSPFHPILAVLAIAIVSLFGWIVGALASSPTLDVDFASDGRYTIDWDGPSISWEAYTCGFENYADKAIYGDWWHISCRLNTASKWALIPLFILVVLSASVSFLIACTRQHEAKMSRATDIVPLQEI